jgi:hypothetical protein
MGQGNFWAFRGGAPEVVPCSVWDDVFRNLNPDQQVKVVCGANALFGEVFWFYPSADSLEPDRFVVFNTVERVWYGGALTRTAWMDRGTFPTPIAACSSTGLLYTHEVGVDADGQPMGEWIESGWVDVDDGEFLTFLDRLLPDWRRLVGSVRLTVQVVDYPSQAPRVRGPFTVAAGTQQVVVRLRGRQMALRIDGDVLAGGDWRLGALRAKAQPDGKVT